MQEHSVYPDSGRYADSGRYPSSGPYADYGASDYGVSDYGASDYGASRNPKTGKFRRSRNDRMVAGVCGGIAERFNIDSALIRVALVLATLLGLGSGLIIYLTCWIVAPED